MAYDTKMEFLTLYKPTSERAKTIASGIIGLDEVRKKIGEIMDECEAAGKDKIRIQVMPATKGRGSHWLSFSCPPDRQTSSAPDDSTADEPAPRKGKGWG